jgi:hypothetical protein
MHEVFKKFQIEVLRLCGCRLMKENKNSRITTFEILDFQQKRSVKIYIFMKLIQSHWRLRECKIRENAAGENTGKTIFYLSSDMT